MKKKKILTVLPAVLLFAIILGVTLPGSGFWKEKERFPIVIFGDSIMGNVRDETSIPARLEQALSVPVLNGAFGGTCATRTNDSMQASFVSDNLCLSSLVEAAVYQDFGVIRSSVAYGMKYKDINRQVLPYFEETAEQLEKTDFGSTQILILAYGTNDYTRASALDNPDNPYDRRTFGGSLRYSIELLQDKYPDMQIVLVTPIYCILFSEDGTYDCTERDFGAGFLEEFADLELEIGQQYGLTVIDNYHHSGIDRGNWEQYLEDGMHPNAAGRELLAKQMAEALSEVLRIQAQQ